MRAWCARGKTKKKKKKREREMTKKKMGKKPHERGGRDCVRRG